MATKTVTRYAIFFGGRIVLAGIFVLCGFSLALAQVGVPVYAPPGQITPGFPPKLLLDNAPTGLYSYSITYSPTVIQYTVAWNSSISMTNLYNAYKLYLPANGWTIINDITLYPTSRGLLARNASSAVSVAIIQAGTGSQASVTYLVGGQNWVVTWGGSQTDSANAVTADASGNVYVVGSTNSFGAGGSDVLLLKYDIAGTLLWQKTWGGPANDNGNGVAVDSNGNVYVTGGTSSFGAGSFDVFLLKFDSSGNLLWSKTWGGGGYDVGYDITLDTTGNVYVAAESYSVGNAAILLKYDPSGNLLWNRAWKGPATYDSAYSVTVDSSGNVLETGISWDYSVSPNHNSILLLKYDSSGNLLWNRNWAGPSEDEAWASKAIQADQSGNVYVAGREAAVCTTAAFNTCDFDFLLLKVDPLGNFLWSSTWKGSTGYDTAGGLALDGAGNPVVTGVIDAFGASPAAALLTYGSNGNLLSSRAWAGSSPTAGHGLAIQGSVQVISGTAPNNTGSWQSFTGTPGTEPGSLTTPTGAVSSPTVTLTSPAGTAGSPIGVIDSGGGGTDVFVSTTSTVGLSPSSLVFGNQIIQTTSTAQQVTLTNSGSASLNITSVVASGAFAQTNTCGTSVAAGANCTISVTFTPTVTGSLSGTITITDNAIGSPQTVALSGNGVSAAVATLSTPNLTFGTQIVGTTSASQTVTITNTGTGPLGIISIATTNSVFGETNNCPTSLAVNASCTITVTFTPSLVGADAGALIITDDAAGSPQIVTLTGNGISTPITLSPTSLSFFNQGFNTTSSQQDVFVQNIAASGSVTISSIAASGDFAQTNDCPTILAAGSSCLVNVTFTPTALGARSGTLTMAFNAPGSPQTVSLSGTGISLTLVPSSLFFSLQQPVGVTSAPQTSTVTNVGPAAVNITSIQATGDFAQTNNCPASLAPAASCVISVTFTPTAVGDRSGMVSINSNLAESPDVINLSGFAIVLRVVPQFIDFSDQTLNVTSAGRTVTLTNTGTTAVTFTSIQTTGDFAQTNTCGTSLAGGASCTVSVTFTPTTVVHTFQTLTITSSAPDSPQTVRLDGNGIVLGITPSFLSFATQLVGTTSAAQTLTVTNTTQAAVTLNSFTISSAFAQTNTCTTLAVGASCTISVTFTPAAAGPLNGSLSFMSSSSTSAVTVGVSGTGTFVSLAPNPVVFGQEPIGTTSAPQTVTLTNQGAVALTISSITTTGDFAETNNCPVSPATLAAGANCAISVTFTPTLLGNAIESLVVASSDAGSPATAVLQGSGPTTTFAGEDVFVGVSGEQVERWSATGQLLQKLHTGIASGVTTGMAFDRAGNLYVTDFFPIPGTVSKFDSTGSLLGTFGSGYNGSPESVLFDANGNVYVGAVNGDNAIRKFDSLGNPIATFLVQPDNRGTDWIDLAQDQCTMYYTSEGQRIKRYNVCTNTQLPDFTNALPGSSAYALRLLPTGGLLVADTEQIVRFDASGNIVQTYTAQGEDGWFALNLDPDGTSFWSAGFSTANVYKFNIASGAVLLKINTGIAISLGGGISGLVVKGQITAATAVLNLVPALVNYGNQLVGSASSPQTITVTNTGTATATISSVTLTGTNPGDFAVSTDTCTGATLNTGANCSLSLTFTPVATGARSAQVNIASNAPGSPQTATLSGIGLAPVAGVSPGTLAFSNQFVSTSSTTQSTVLSNTGTAPLTITSIVATGDYSQTNNCGTSLAALSGSCTIIVTFTPTAAGARPGAITITDNNNAVNGSTQTVTLSGTGTAPVAGVLPASLAFGNQLVGTPSATQSTVLSNTGTAPLTIATIVASGDYSQTNNCAGSVAVGGSCTITVTFTPTAAGTRPGAITITDNNNAVNGSTQTVTLSGTGLAPAVTLSATSLALPDTHVNQTCTPRTVTLTNSGTAPLTISSISISGPYTQTNTCPATLAAGASCAVTVTFAPTVVGTAEAGTLTITSNAPSSPNTVALSGNATAACLLLPAVQTVTLLRGTDSTTFSLTHQTQGGEAEAPIQMSCTNQAPANCAFDPGTIGAMGVTTLTLTNLKALTSDALLFQIHGDANLDHHTTGLSVLFSDFLVASTPITGAITAGQTGSYALAVAPQNGLQGTVSFSCTGAPIGATCAVAPATVMLSGTATQNVTVTVTTTARSLVAPRDTRRVLPPGSSPMGLMLLAMLALLAGLVFCSAGVSPAIRGSESRATTGATTGGTARLRLATMGLGLMLAVVLTWAACGGGAPVAPMSQNAVATPAGTYNLTATGTFTAAGSSAQIVHDTTLTLTVH